MPNENKCQDTDFTFYLAFILVTFTYIPVFISINSYLPFLLNIVFSNIEFIV